MGILEVKNVKKIFKNGSEDIVALDTTNFEIKKSEFVAIIGPSGSGKSTLLSLIGGLQKPTEGEVIINGTKINDLSKKELNNLRFKEIGFIFQASNLIPFLKVKEQLILCDKYKRNKIDKNKNKELLKDLGIEKLANKYPDELSGGEKQRVAIATALAENPNIILADEPTASLDSKKAYEVVELLAVIAKKIDKAVVMVTHDERLLKYCDRIFYIEDGKLEERKV